MPKSIKLKDNTYWDTEGISHNQQTLKDFLNNLVLESVYPVGSLYMSMNSTSPATLFGGTWERMTGGFIYGCVNDSGTGNGTGTSTNSHTLTTNQIPSHGHSGITYGYGNPTWRGTLPKLTPYWKITGTAQFNYTTQDSTTDLFYPFGTATTNTGGGQGHSHNIPYMAVYVWKRTA